MGEDWRNKFEVFESILESGGEVRTEFGKPAMGLVVRQQNFWKRGFKENQRKKIMEEDREKKIPKKLINHFSDMYALK